MMKKKLMAACLLVIVSMVLTACFETESETTLNKDGSGSFQASVDFSSVMMFLTSKKKEGEQDIAIDTTIFFKTFTDTSSALTARQKELMKDMKLKMLFDSKNSACVFTVSSVFKSTEDFNEMNKLMAKKEFDDLFDGAVNSTPFGGEEESGSSSGKNDNIFGSLFPAFFDCEYASNSIICKLNQEKYDQALADLKKSDMSLDDKLMEEMLGTAKFTNKINLPGKPVTVEGTTLKEGATTAQLVQTGSLYDLYKNPQKYTYQVRF